MSAPSRLCPLCDVATELANCPNDRMATLLVQPSVLRPALPQPGTIVGGRYEITCPIGHGGHGAVFSARHLGTGQDVALKIMTPPADADELLSLKRFFLEARVTSGLKHPNTVRVFDFGQDDGGLVFLALELLSGSTLKKAIREKKAGGSAFSEAEAIEIAAAITRSLAEAHAAGLVHRDLKPENVFLHQVSADERVVKVLDFGIAKLGSGHPTLSTPEATPGTPAYMSPEQALSGTVDARSDLYALGVILFQLVASELPFSGGTDAELLHAHAYRAAPDVRALAKVPVSARFAEVVARALAKEPAERFASAGEMRAALSAPSGTDTVSVVAPPRRSSIAGRLAIAGVVAVVVGFGAMFAARVEEKPAPIVEALPAPPSEDAAAIRPEPVPAQIEEAAPAQVVDAPKTKRAVKKRAAKSEDILHRRIEDLVPAKKD